ncbi:hypothetical protein M440DRAFT_1406512 [Trichoderma longibrachiatum ATCC 18648]|uniref:Uncharacterized protein n=1 Tax=Trichoderma longibrachiatum ATCC 18648 TaxID=983965 RepID=A0A2T4BQE1_TRILO|nr:hypothetical protein M440DRAFT_1406512 [Trichoderma longibrachiatum ATCC 18648]
MPPLRLGLFSNRSCFPLPFPALGLPSVFATAKQPVFLRGMDQMIGGAAPPTRRGWKGSLARPANQRGPLPTASMQLGRTPSSRQLVSLAVGR